MHSPLTAIVLCVFVQSVSAQCLSNTPAVHNASTSIHSIKTSALTTPVVASVTTPMPAPAAANTTRPSGELIKAAAASTRDTPSSRTASRSADGADSPRRSGTGMLFAALALMSAIVLRRFGNP